MKNLRGRRAVAGVALFAAELAAVGCSDEWAPHPHVDLPAMACGTAGTADGGAGACYDLLADFDNSTYYQRNGRSGGWFSYDDKSLSAPDGAPGPLSIQFSPQATFDPSHQTFPGMAPSSEALHAFAGAYSGAFGTGLGINFNSQKNIKPACCSDPAVAASVCDPVHSCQDSYHAQSYDASPYAGVILWVRRGATPDVSSSVRVQITTVATDSDYAKNYGSGLAETGAKGRDPLACDPNPGSTVRCDDDYGKVLTLLSDWSEPYKIPWSDLDQEGFGRIPPEGFQPREVVTIKFTNKQGQAFDEWFDDVALYKE
jgi:hypothetical protein